jgi:hypothetical protein
METFPAKRSSAATVRNRSGETDTPRNCGANRYGVWLAAFLNRTETALERHFSAVSAARVSIRAETREGGEQMKITITKVEKIEATRPHTDPNAVA